MRPAAPPSKKTLQPDDEPTPPLTRGAPITAPSPLSNGAPRSTALANLGAAQSTGARSVSNPPPPAYLNDEDDVDELARMKAAHDNPFSGVNSANRQSFGGTQRTMQPAPAQSAPQDPRAAAKQRALDEAKAAAAQKTRDANNGVSNLSAADRAAFYSAQQGLAADKAQALQTAAAKSGAAGFGLSGASAAIQGDVGNAADRNAVQTLAQLRGSLSEQEFNAIQQTAATNDEEAAENVDLNGDGYIDGMKVGGKVGDHNPADLPNYKGTNGKNNPTDPNNPQHNDYVAAQTSAGGTGTAGDPYGGIGGYGDQSQQVLTRLENDGITFSYQRTEYGAVNGERYIIALGSDGKTYKFKVPGSGIGKDMPDDPTGSKWFALSTSQPS
jgi:hypothetical protein